MRKSRGKHKKNWRLFFGAIVLAASMMFTPAVGNRVYAATTCTSVLSFPGSTTTNVNVREKAGTGYKSYGVVSANTPVTILGTCMNGKESWYKVNVTVNGTKRTGYIFSSYVKKASNVTGTVKVSAGSCLNLRKSASTSSLCLAKLPNSTKLTITGISGPWYAVSVTVNGSKKTGYVSAAYVTVSESSSNNTTQKPAKTVSTSKLTTGYVNNKVTSALNVRKKASTKSAVIVSIPAKTTVTVTAKKGNWYKIKLKYGGKTVTGYVAKKYITLGKSSGGTTTTTPTTTTNTTSKAAYVNTSVKTKLKVRKKATTKASVLAKLSPKKSVTVKGTCGSWYKIKFTYNKKKITGYVKKKYITIGRWKNSSGTTTEKTTQKVTTEEKPTNNVAYETLLKKFPDSYKASLNKLHSEYPNWKFVAVNTNQDWSTVIANESIVGRNVIQSNYPRGYGSLAPFSYLSTESGAYNWSTDSYVVKDGSNWYSADSRVIAYYMDPRNFLNSTDIFQFEALAFESSQKPTVVQSILSNTFMSGSYNVVDSATNKRVSGTYKQAFMDAGTKAKASPYFLAARSKQEVGVRGSNATSGTYAGYEGIYNFYNIGAFDGTDAVAKGLQWARTGTAYNKPWTNPYKSIVGGAQYIAKQYINAGQNTLYFQKFNVNPLDDSKRYLHQYMTNVQAPYSEGRSTRAAYSSLGILKDEMVFYIPVYNNMPSKACALPATAGNPNPFLSSITVKSGTKKYAVTPSFSLPSATGTLENSTYTMVVPSSVSKVVIDAKAISRYTTISGTGTYTLGQSGTTKKIKLTGKAQNGKTQTYTLNITRK